MTGKRGAISITWTPEQDQALRDIWPTNKRIKEHMHLFGEHNYGAIITRAYDIGLGRRPKRPCASAFCWPLIERELKDGSANRYRIADRLGIHPGTTHRELTAKHDAGLVHIANWERRTRTSAMIPVYALGPGVDVPKPPKLTNTESCRRRRAHTNERRVVQGETVRSVNPFATAAGLVDAPVASGGRAYVHLTDDELEAA